MNFLAHLYLSGESEKIMVGNFIADFVKGRKYENYKSEIREGILLHRSIDSYTDTHPIVSQSGKYFREVYRKYSGVITDLVYDHFLAKNWGLYHKQALPVFVSRCHEAFVKNYLTLPNQVKLFLPFLISSRRLETYAEIEGLRTALNIMVRRTSLPDKTDLGIEILLENYEALESEFHTFMREIITYVSKDKGIELKYLVE
ncbi:ACP phosphodiesterase [Ancylomarina sp. DW003]|nr:ACP phosphodiesterase [Ancylomarina sp. DW003]MDE5420966.1 ACP phosphodiesterase [Ancylomarina sp. DW003]